MKKYVFVILHYYTKDDTYKCVESIQRYGNGKSIDIVIVDNASPNGSGKIIKEKYKNEKNIHVIINSENLGFAKGNNVGLLYAKKNLNPDFIIMCNNDTYLIQKDFFELIEKEYEDSNFAVLGPQILLRNYSINNIVLSLPDYKSAKKQLRDIRIDYITNFFCVNKLYYKFKEAVINLLVKIGIKKRKKIVKPNLNERYEDIVLHGSFLIFSKKYIAKFDGLDDRTFLYREEELLALRLKRNQLKSVYNPDIKIFHNEDGATNAITKSNRKKQLFICKNLIRSTKILLSELQK